MIISWIEPNYSLLQLDKIRRINVDRFDPDISDTLLVDISVGQFTERIETSGLVYFYRSIMSFYTGLLAKRTNTLIINEDDWKVLKINSALKGSVECNMHIADSVVGSETLSAEKLHKVVKGYLADFQDYVGQNNLGFSM